MKIEKGYVTFSSGRRRYCGGPIGIDPGSFVVYEGHDGKIWRGFEDDEDDGQEENVLSPEDLKELADYMIQRWQEFKAHIESSAVRRSAEPK